MLKSSRWARLGAWIAGGLLALALGLLVGVGQPAQAQAGGSSFDHSATGYPLLGQHENVRCETCHQRGIFKGTPRDCATCHARNNTRDARAMPVKHAVTTQACDSCHTVNGFAGAIFSHVGVAPGGCITCHNNTNVQGKPLGHVSTNASCDQCHNTRAFLPAAAKPDNHIPVAAGAACSDCHRNPNFAVMPPLSAIHAHAPSTQSGCALCHGDAAASFARPSSGFAVVGKPTNHIPTSAPCELCHVAAGAGVASLPVPDGARFSGALMNHAGIASGCADCHRPADSPTSFAGITAIVGMPPTSPAGAGAHIPSTTTCESCHLASTPVGSIAANASKAPPGTGFASPAPSAPQIHAGVTSGCSSCHESSLIWLGMGAYPMTPTTLVPGAQYRGFQTRPKAAATATSVADPAHPSSGDCSQCHASTSAFSGVDRPGNHIPFAATAQCSSCHTSSDYSVMPSLAAIHANAPSTTSNCAQCHGAAATGFAIPAAGFSIVGLPANHLPTTASCEVCHVGPGSSITALPVVDGAKFSGSLMSHTGISSNCASCHQPSGSSASFAGITRIVGMPATSPAGPLAHIPSVTTCESCHLASVPTSPVAANATATVPGTGFATPAPSGAQIHAGISSGCNSCHEASLVWLGISAYPISPSTLVPGGRYTGFQTRPRAAATATSVADPAHPSSGDCSQCHGNTTAFTGVDKPANHIPYVAAAQCSACHTNVDYGVMPALADIHANAPSTTGNCAQCHGAAAASFAIPAANFAIVGLPANHIPTSASCETCHVGTGSSIAVLPVANGAKFSGSLMNHAGISSNCVACHLPSGTTTAFAGISRIVGMPPTNPAGSASHIPSSTSCETCHLATLPSGLIAASATKTAPGTAFATPAPTGIQIHTGVTAGCNACHEASMVWMGVSAYPISPSTLVAGASYNGFQTRPRSAAGTYNVADAAHPASGDCSQCHGNTTAFSGVDRPANHIPFAATAQCNSCHTSSDYAIVPTLANIHLNAPSTTGNCTQCHGAAASSFAIPALGFAIVGLPANHIPTTASCETCHVGTGSSIAALPVGNGAKFAGSLMSHAGISSNCVACHQASGSSTTFAGIARIVGMPPTSPAGAGSHIPSSTSCESCHLATVPSGLIAAAATKTAPGTAFQTPAPTGAQIHAGISSGCNTCHEASMVWMGVSAYPISPSTLVAGASYQGFQTRPRAAASTFSVADPAHPGAGDCSQCHGNTTAFTGIDKPSNHIPYAVTAQCSSCHTGSDYAVMPTVTNIHAYAPSTTGNCAQCHGAAAASFAIPAANFAIVGLPGDHIPTTASCETCHVGAGSSIAATPVVDGAKFSNSLMSHAGITTNCVACHVRSGTSAQFSGISAVTHMPATSPAGPNAHIPTTGACETCHLGTTPPGLIAASATRMPPGTGFATPAPTGVQIHTGVTSGCSTCHEATMVWMGVSAYPIAPTTLIPGANYNGFQTRPGPQASAFAVADAAHPASGDCAQCHLSTTAFTGVVMPGNHIPYATTAQCSSCHKSADYTVLPSLTDIHANATSTINNCAQCHGDAVRSFDIAKSSFAIVGKPGNHVPTAVACEVCHVGPGSSMAALPVVNGAKFSNSLMSHTGITTNCAACHGPAISSSSFAGISKIVVMPPTSPMGASSHIPSSTTCESCHLGTTPTGLVPANAAKSAPGTAFQSPAPSGVQIHAGVTGGCNTCHDTGAVWMGVSAYPIAPSAKSAVAGSKYNGFQTRPTSTGSTFAIKDSAHPNSGDCGQCHGNTTAFSGVDVPANHIPYSASAQCDSCHKSTDYAVQPSVTDIHANAQSTTINCLQCHGPAAPTFAIPAASFAIVGLPGNHLPTTASCEVCHVGAGSSITATPVVTGAKFSNSLMSHTGINSNCAVCHGPTISGASFAGITKIVVMPPTSPVGASSHIPSSTTCETCHLGTTPSGQIAANATKSAPGSGFQSPAPTGVQIHSGITGGCNACHDTNAVWMGVSAYPIIPSSVSAVAGAKYNGFQTRPKAAGSTYAIADSAHPSDGDCSQCHASTTAFVGVDKPANHIPYAASAQCSSCHTSSDYAALPTLANIHANAPSTANNCVQCHGAAAPTFAIPAAGFSIVGLPGNHMPTSASCEVCHVGTASSVTTLPVGNGAKFSGSQMNHTGITSNCVACHGPGITGASFAGVSKIVVMPPTSPAGAGSHIPSSTTCESCHLGSTPSGFGPANATATAPGTLFALPAPTGLQIHSGITSGCNTCHEAGVVWMGMGAYPLSPATLVPGAQYRGFQTRPNAAGGTYNVADAQHPAGRDCSECHSSTSYFVGPDKPSNHIPYASTAVCDNCHTTTDYKARPTLADIHANAPSTTTNCAQCHGAAASSFAIPASSFAIVGLPSNHIPTSTSCEACHVGAGSSIAAVPVPNGAVFAGSLMNHAGITTNCASCHQPYSSTPTAFAGIAKIVGMPPATTPGTGSHIPSSTTCEDCHLGSTPTGPGPASATKTAPGTAFATPAPTGLQIHKGITGSCNTCHDTSMVWMGLSAYPISPSVVTPNGQYKGFQTRPKAAASPYAIADVNHPTTGDCSQCHGSTTVFTGFDMPANHIPFATGTTCDQCHTGNDYSVMPTITAIHAYAPSTSANCAQCHGSTVRSFDIASAKFAIVGLPSNHVPTTASCEVCHVGTGSSMAATPVVNGAKFANSRMSHAGITTNCESCHVPAGTSVNFAGISAIVGMPPTSPMGANAHIPSSTVCANCHGVSSVSGLIPANASKTAPGTLFGKQASGVLITGLQIHTGISGGCSSCHDSNMVWMGMSNYPITPSVITTNGQYKGFQTRPIAGTSTYRVADAGHPTTGECSLCHTSTTAFAGVNLPGNHIPYATTATCINCHTDPNYAVMPTLTNIHAYAQSTTSNCAQCHSAAAVTTYAIPSANFSIVGLPANGTHIPTTASCEVCHVGSGSSIAATPVVNGAKFSGSLMSHAGITSNCVACHVTSSTVPAPYTGITRIVGMPATSPVGASSHIPSSTACEACHLTSTVTGLIPASATATVPGTKFGKAGSGLLVTGLQIHTGITNGCNACHEASYVWLGVGNYPITPTTTTGATSATKYYGFQTRPRSAAGTYNVLDAGHPTGGDCSDCHTSTTYFDGAAKPTGHIPTTATCATCHVKSGDYTIGGLGTNAQIHTGITTNCASCHAGGPFAGSGQVLGSAQCATASLPYVPKPMPLSSCGASTTASNALTHIPVGSVGCEQCHGVAGTGATYTTFKMAMTAMKPGTTTGPVAGTSMHNAVPNPTFLCMSCHEAKYTWFGGTIMTRDKGSHNGTAQLTHDCSECHTLKSSFSRMARIRPVMRAAVGGGMQRLLPRDVPGAGAGSAAGPFDHRGVSAGQCLSCHNGQLAKARPVKHYGNRLSCDSCHRTSSWTPAQYTHAPGATGQCAVCHNGVDASPRPGNHFITVRACDSCHRTLAWLPVQYQHLSPAYQHSPDKNTCVSCHITNGEVIPRQLHGNTRQRPVPVPPAK